MMDFLTSSFWGRVIVGALATSGAWMGLAGTAAVVRTYTLDTRVALVETSVSNLDDRQRADHDAIISLSVDVRYTREAVTMLLDARGIERPQE